MKKTLLILLLLIPRLTFAQELLPYVEGTFTANDGSPLSSGYICTTISGTTTNLATYPTYADAVAGTNANANPVHLDSAGRANIWLGASAYRIVILNTTGQGSSTCNGTPTGSAIKTVDGVPGAFAILSANNIWSGNNTFKEINNTQFCDSPSFTGANAGAKIISCIAALPSTGGTADARGFQGSQAITSIITISKPVRLLLGSATFTSTVTAGNNSIILLASAGASVECAGPGNTQILASTDSNGISITSSPASVKDCTLTGPNIGASVRQGINGGIGDVEISGNVIEKWGNGINTGAGSSPGLYWKIHDNTVRLNNADGIFIPSDNNVVSNNAVYGNLSNGIDLNGNWNTVSANVLVSNGSGHSGTDCWGILLAAVPGLNSNNNTVVGNTVDKSTCQNIILKPTTSQTVNGNTISGNTATGAIAANGDGIAIDGSSAGAMINNIITGNKTSGNARHGIVIDGSVGTVTGNTVSVNISSSNVSDGLLVTSGASSNKLSDNISLANGTNLVDSGTGTVKSGNITTSGPGFWVDSAADGVQGIFYGDRTNGWALSERADASTALRITASGIPTGLDRLNLSSGGNLAIIGSEQLAGATPTSASGYLGLGTTNSVGSGTSGTTVTTVTKGAGNGPTTAQTVVNYLKISISGTDYWIPLMQVVVIFRRPKYRIGRLK